MVENLPPPPPPHSFHICEDVEKVRSVFAFLCHRLAPAVHVLPADSPLWALWKPPDVDEAESGCLKDRVAPRHLSPVAPRLSKLCQDPANKRNYPALVSQTDTICLCLCECSKWRRIEGSHGTRPSSYPCGPLVLPCSTQPNSPWQQGIP